MARLRSAGCRRREATSWTGPPIELSHAVPDVLLHGQAISIHGAGVSRSPPLKGSRALTSGARRVAATLRANSEVEHSGSRSAVDSDLKGSADFAHAGIGETTKSLDKNTHGNAFNRVEIDRRRPRDGIVASLQEHLAGQAPNRRGAGRNDRAFQSWDRCITGQDDYRTATNVREFTPPDLTAGGNRAHDAAAASRNDARSPHSSTSLSGCVSYAA